MDAKLPFFGEENLVPFFPYELSFVSTSSNLSLSSFTVLKSASSLFVRSACFLMTKDKAKNLPSCLLVFVSSEIKLLCWGMKNA